MQYLGQSIGEINVFIFVEIGDFCVSIARYQLISRDPQKPAIPFLAVDNNISDDKMSSSLRWITLYIRYLGLRRREAT